MAGGRRSAGYDSAPVAYAVAFGLSCGQVFFSPAAQSLLPSVVDGAFMPSIGAVNPTLTINANAIRVAEHIAKRIT